MNIVEKRIIGAIEFTATESKFLMDLSNTIRTCCNDNEDDCGDYCPFKSTREYCGCYCSEMADFLFYIAKFGAHTN